MEQYEEGQRLKEILMILNTKTQQKSQMKKMR